MGTVAYHQARALAAAGAQVTVFTTRDTEPRQAPPGVELVELRALVARGTPPVCRRCCGGWRFDVVHLHYHSGTAIVGGGASPADRGSCCSIRWMSSAWKARLPVAPAAPVAGDPARRRRIVATRPIRRLVPRPNLPALSQLAAIPGGVDLSASRRAATRRHPRPSGPPSGRRCSSSPGLLAYTS
jgi:hypothetical protein